MISILFFKRVISNKIFGLSVMAALLLLVCSIVYTDDFTGETYTFLSLFYDKVSQEALKNGQISLSRIFMGYDTSYLWMFSPIIVGVPCVLTKKIERFVLFRSSKNQYYLAKYFTNLFLGGSILLLAYLEFLFLVMILEPEFVWSMYLVRKLLSVFCWGVLSAVSSIVLSEFIENKYLILCVPFVLNYFMCMFLGNIIPNEVYEYISPYTYQILFLYDNQKIFACSAILLGMIAACAFVIKISFERRCDCGQK